MMKKGLKKNFKFILLIIQTIISLGVVYFIFNIGLIPFKYGLIIIALLFLLNFLVAYLFIENKASKFSQILSIFISISLMVGIIYSSYGKSFLKKITGAQTDTHVMSLVVLADSAYGDASEISEDVIGITTKFDQSRIEKAIALIEQKYKFNPNTSDYDDLHSLTNHLYDESINVILINESHRSIIEEYYPNFEEETKIIGSINIDEEVTLDKKDVNILKDTFTFFITGIDTYGPVSTVSRSDVNMLMTVNPVTNQILLTSIPRDYHVILASYNAYDKLTHAGNFGVGESVKTLEKLFDIDIDYYLKVNFSSVEQIVNALGGINVYSKYQFSVGTYQYDVGVNYMDGSKALRFARERYQLPNGDNDRVFNQQEVIKGIINKALSPAIITNYVSILNSVSSSMQMSISEKDFTSLIKNQINNNNSWDIVQYQVGGYGSKSTTTFSMPGYNLYVMEPDYNTVNYAHELIMQMENNEVISVN